LNAAGNQRHAVTSSIRHYHLPGGTEALGFKAT
jgi:hypothetical protein